MISDIKELNFPKIDGVQYATLAQATATLADMGEKSITTQVRIDGDIVPDFSYDWEVEFQGEKYIMPLRIPQGTKENTSLDSTIDLTFQHWAVYQLKRWPFVTIQQISAGTYLPDEEEATVQLNLKDFCTLFGQVLEYYFGDAISIDLNPAWQYSQEATIISISHTKIWNVLVEALYDQYAVRWEIQPASGNSNTAKGGERYVIRVGYPTTEVDHVFEYGFDGGLLKVERQVQSEEIRNMLKGRGGETNIPFRYFKNTDANNPDFLPDPDWVEELSTIYFTNLMPATFRSYIQGWKAAHISDYPDYTAVGEANAYAPWAYRKGYTDTKFSPVEFVADEITIAPGSNDGQTEILPGYSPYIVQGSSIDKYGPLPDTLDNNEDIYPTLQGTGLDIAVDIEQIESDDATDSAGDDVTVMNLGSTRGTKYNIPASAYATVKFRGNNFSVPNGKTAYLTDDAAILSVYVSGTTSGRQDIATTAELTSKTINVYDATTGELRSASGITEGTYYYEIEAEVHNLTTDKSLDITVGTTNPTLTYTTIKDNRWRGTFDIWVKNIWDSEKLSTESDAQYAERVWKPVLGNREGDSAKVVFTSGNLAISEDYEFTIVDIPVYDTSKSWDEKDSNGNIIATHTAHWRIKLAKCDAELESTGLYIPSTKKQGAAGDRFVFIGTEMTHIPYVVDAEKRLDDWKKDQLRDVKEIKPTFVVTTDRVRLNNEGKSDALIHLLRVGNSIRLADKRLVQPINGLEYETLYLQSITYTYREPTSDDAALNPDVEIVLGNEYISSGNPVSMMQGEISALQRQVGAISNIEQIVRTVGDSRFLSKIKSDRTPFALGVGGRVTADNGVQFGSTFAAGLTGFNGLIDGQGQGWLDSLSLRRFLEVPELRYNRVEIQIGNKWNAPGGGIVQSCVPDVDANGNELMTGTVTLHLEDGEIGTVAVDDICMGIFHDGVSTAKNASSDYDDSIGNFHFAGFYTCYFRITEITETGRNSVFRYALRPVSGNWAFAYHPAEAMHFVGYGNFTDTARQTSRYSTRTYERYLKDVSNWEFTSANIAAQFGDLSNLSVYGLAMSGYSAYLHNIYMSGTIQQFERLDPRMEIDTGGDTFLAYGESKTIVCTVYRGWEELTSQVTSWTITRDSGDSLADASWNADTKAQTFAGTITLTLNATEDDINVNSGVPSTLFTITADLPTGAPATGVLSI